MRFTDLFEQTDGIIERLRRVYASQVKPKGEVRGVSEVEPEVSHSDDPASNANFKVTVSFSGYEHSAMVERTIEEIEGAGGKIERIVPWSMNANPRMVTFPDTGDREFPEKEQHTVLFMDGELFAAAFIITQRLVTSAPTHTIHFKRRTKDGLLAA